MTTTNDVGANKAILEFLANHGVALELSVQLLFRMRRQGLSRFANEHGYSRQMLYFALRGDRAASRALRTAFKQYLGIDPWTVYETAGVPRGTPQTNHSLQGDRL